VINTLLKQKENAMSSTIRVRFVSNDSGYATWHDVQAGTTLEQFVSSRLGDVNPKDYTIRANRQEQDGNFVLQNEMLVSATPRNLKAAI
jgi:hypothetical protein